MTSRISFLLGLCCLFSLPLEILPAAEPSALPKYSDAELARIKKWEKQIASFEESDAKTPPKQGGAVFVGSSSIRLWNLEKSFPDVKLPLLNRGFGGSQMADTAYFAERLVIKHRPSVVFVYAGDNDIGSKKTTYTILLDYQAFVKQVHAQLPETQIVYIGVKPSIKRWQLIEQVRETNKKIATWSEKNPRLHFMDVDAPMLNAEGQPQADLFREDGLHLNDKGYAVWSKLALPYLMQKSE